MNGRKLTSAIDLRVKLDYEYCQLTNLIEVREIDFFLLGYFHQIILKKLKKSLHCVMK